MITFLRSAWEKLFPPPVRHRRLAFCSFPYPLADKLIRQSADKPERDQWRIAPEEDANHVFGMVYLERRERIV